MDIEVKSIKDIIQAYQLVPISKIPRWRELIMDFAESVEPVNRIISHGYAGDGIILLLRPTFDLTDLDGWEYVHTLFFQK